MRLCASCRRREAYGVSGYCRPCHTAYMRAWRGPRRITPREKAREWLKIAPRTSAQLAELLNVSKPAAAMLLLRIRREDELWLHAQS